MFRPSVHYRCPTLVLDLCMAVRKCGKSVCRFLIPSSSPRLRVSALKFSCPGWRCGGTPGSTPKTKDLALVTPGLTCTLPPKARNATTETSGCGDLKSTGYASRFQYSKE